MDEHRHDRLTVTAMIIAIILLVAVNLTFILMKPAGTGMERSVTEPGGGKTLATTAAAAHPDAREVCETLAPKAVKAYTGHKKGRARLLKIYFTDDAQGLNIPADRIAAQPDVQYVGALNTGDGSSAVCSVHTGLESPWMLTWRWDVDAGWLCTGINGPLEGAYTTLGDTAPGNAENTK